VKLSRPARIVMALAIVLAVLAAAAAAITLAGSVADIWQRLREGPLPVFVGLLAFLATIGGLGAWLVWRLLSPKKNNRVATPLPDRDSLERRIAEGRAQGIDVAAAEHELEELARRRSAGRLYLCLFGEISTGKSSLVRALAPDAEVDIGVTGGTTRGVTHYHWRTNAGDEILLSDVPGSSLDAADDETGLQEAVRAHVVLYICSADLTRRQFEDLSALAAIEKPLILALNKTDLYSEDEASRIVDRLRQRLEEAGAGRDSEVVSISTREAGPEGESQGIDPLRKAIQRRIDCSPEALEALRNRAVFTLVDEQLTAAESERRRAEAAALVKGYTSKAVVGALAAVSPGTDILIQGYLGRGMVRELCDLYEVKARDMDVSRLLDLSQSYVGRMLPITLAVAGNALKAFPGVGTIAGGVTHAVAYGLIFDALGKGLSRSLAEGGELRPAAAARRFRESMSEDLGARTIRIARMAIEERKGGDAS
jgi:GTP-binding protein EngB required for normal cell division